MTTLQTRQPPAAPPPPTENSIPNQGHSATIHPTWSQIPQRLAQLAAARASAEETCRTRHEGRVTRAETVLRDAIAAAANQRAASAAELASQVGTSRNRANGDFAAETAAAEAERQTLRKTAKSKYQNAQEKAASAHGSARWETGTMFENDEKGAREWRKESETTLAHEAQLLDVLRDETQLIAYHYRGYLPKNHPALAEFVAGEPDGDPFPRLRSLIEQADATLLKLEALKLPRAFQGPKMVWVVVLPLLSLAYPAWRSWQYVGITAGAIGATVASLAIGYGLRRLIVAKSRVSILRHLEPLLRDLAEGARLIDLASVFVRETDRLRMQDATTRRDRETAKAEESRDKAIEAATTRRDERLREAEDSAKRRVDAATSMRDGLLSEAAETDARRGREIVEQHAAEHAEARARHRAAMDDANAKRDADWKTLADAWSSGMGDATATIDSIRAEIDARFPAWPGMPPTVMADDLPGAIRFGQLVLRLDKMPGGISGDPKLRQMAPETILIPALAAFPEHASIAFEFPDEAGRRAAIEGMQAVILRFLTGLPAGRVRLTILDPLGLGRNFAGFMHLADFSEALVNTRIWTEPQQIDARLSELNVHVELVIQNYLRNEYPTIESYNVQAAEVAEPYRILVVPDFPAGFNESTAKRLLAIAKSGPRCGVYVVLGLDTSATIPPAVTREELLKPFVRVTWRDQRFVLRDPIFERFALEVDRPPDVEVMTKLLHKIGEAAQAANRVEVPFSVIAPKAEDYWKGDSRSEVVVPLGRSGATKLQTLRLGRGTSQHVLIAGRTGSGKSTLLHALITNSALIYGPDEIELYLIDFKKGVEFKTYATHGLPHARVIAIESEREFGLSVLQRLDAELKQRGDLYRDLGVQDVAAFRAAMPDRPMPRILLIVDEFQEFFVEDDKLAQESSLLLDRLVRQGRAFGVHVHLGSQTLGGAYSLARSTLGQMAVRIALQCSEADAHLILNEENSAARLLSRPGEAIYNDANGQSEGNHIFQVVWLPDARREEYLKAIASLAKERGVKSRPTIVFEGNKPSDLTLLPLLIAPRQPRTGTIHAVLGEAVAIKDPTAAAFRAQGGNNLLMIGQNEEMAVGIATAAMLGLAAQLPDGARLFLLDGTPDESGFSRYLARLAPAVPIPVTVGDARGAAAILAEVAAEVERRQDGSGDASPWFLFIHDLPRFRDLRKTDDDFAFGRRGEEKVVSPAKLFGTILRDGPALGIHAIVWCDSLNNANRALDRAALREFEMRVLFQMSPGDSSNLIDSPIASRLGANRALFSNEEEGRVEKFRPYGVPSAEWLAGRVSN